MKKSIHNKGFTLVETLIAILILTLAVGGAFSAISGSLRAAFLAKNQIIAFYLAQDGFEYVRNMRDSASLDPSAGWTAFKSALAPCSSAKCKINTLDQSGSLLGIQVCPGNCPLYYDKVKDIYNYDMTKAQTNFERSLKVSHPNPYEVAVTITVSWREGILPRSFIMRDSLFDWQ